MMFYYLGGKILSEKECSEKTKTDKNHGVPPQNLEKFIEESGFDYESKSKGFTEEDLPSSDIIKFSKYIKESLKKKEPILILSNDYGGHYNIIIGYDDMGTEGYYLDDVIILADPYDETDHISDGYIIWGYPKLFAQMEHKVLDMQNSDHYFIKIKRKI